MICATLFISYRNPDKKVAGYREAPGREKGKGKREKGKGNREIY